MFLRDKYGGKENVFKLFGIGMEKLKDQSEKCPWLHGTLFGESSQCYWSKMCCGIAFGIFVGIAFYELILVDLAFERGTVYILGIVFTSVITAGCAVSSQIRCITLLTIPSFSGKSGRHIVQAIITTTIITGPMANIITNIEEIMRMYSCSNSLTYNLSQARYDLLVKPFKIAFLNSKVDTEELKDMFGSVNNVVEPFAQEIEGVDDIKLIQEENDYMDAELNDTKRSEELKNKYRLPKKFKREEKIDLETNNTNTTASESEEARDHQHKYFKKLETRCENVKTGMGQMCKKRFKKFKEQCEDAIHWAISWAVCWPMKLDVICDLVKIFTYGGYDCDPSSDVSSGIGEGFMKLKNSGQTMRSRIAEERVQYKVVKPPNFVALFSVITITKEFAHDIYTKKSFADAVLSLVKTMLAFMFILVINRAASYHNNFIKFTDFDNGYVSADFRVLDARRHKLKQRSILPLMKAEKKRLADPYSLCLGPSEKEIGGHTYLLIIALSVVCLLIVAMDISLALTLKWMNDNLEFSYKQSGIHSFKIDVDGIGFVAGIIRSILRNFDFKKELKGEVSNKPCLPRPRFLVKSQYLKLAGSLGLLFFMAYSEGYIKRMRRAICAFYYREQEKRRIETLYKKTLVFREHLIKKQLEELQEKAKAKELESDLPPLYRLYQRVPWCTCLRLFAAARPTCVVCEDSEPLFGFKYHCCSKCKSHYCMECWTNFSFICYICIYLNSIKHEQEQIRSFAEDL